MEGKKMWVSIICVGLLIEVIAVVISTNHNLVFQQLKKWPYKMKSSNINTSTKKFHMRNDAEFMNFSSKLYNNSSRIGQNAKIWPMPKYFSNGENKLYISSDFELKTVGSEYGDRSGILKDGFSRIMDVVTVDHRRRGAAIDDRFLELYRSAFLRGINVVVHSPNDELQYDVDESYYLAVPDPIKPGYALIEVRD